MEFVEGRVEEINFEPVEVGRAPARPDRSDIEQAIRTLIAAAGDDRGKSRLHVDAGCQSAWRVDGNQMLAR